MPTYHYQCRDCGHAFDQFQKFSEDPLTVCPECGGVVQRVIQNVGVVFKGSGWYITDSRKPAESASKGENGASKKDSSDTSAGGKAETSTKKEPAATAAPAKSSSE